ncbi:MAG: shikimate dehydrogenase [Ignavibacteriales bacterium]|nr:MAG: shikimate dehydrogenase [Ignavibacteriales bacterium]
MTKNSNHSNTKLLGLLGHPIRQSYSPFIHNVASELLNLDYIYLPFDVPTSNLKNAIKGMIALGIRGFNITIPHKENILPHLNNLSEEASLIGSVNTIVNELGKLNGYNTDVHGILESLSPYKDEITGSQVTIIGSGGSARAVLYTLIRHLKPKKIFLINRTEQRAEHLKNYFRDKMKYTSIRCAEFYPPSMVDVLNSSKLVVNATPVGMIPKSDDTITTLGESFTKGQIVFDLVYNPTQTKLLKLASGEGAVTLDGLKMLIHQAAKSFELWTGEKMPIEQVYKSLQLYLAN